MTHYPGHLRAAFTDWIDDGQPDSALVEVDHEPTSWPARTMLGRMCHCTDVMPGEVCARLGMPTGSTYAAAAQRLLRERSAAGA